MRRYSVALVVLAAAFAAGCSDDENDSSGGASGNTSGGSGPGGMSGSSGRGGASTGGAAGSTGTGGSTSTSSGGATAGSGGIVESGGTSSGGGASGSGGVPSGDSGATSTSGAGGSAGGGAPNGGSGGGSKTMSFFVTSKGGDKGGDFGGLEGADGFCKSLATSVSAELGQKQWRAYLSTSTVDAASRIGSGPWRNQAGRIIANTLTELHDQLGDAAQLNAIWPVADTSIALDETGMPLENAVHDILTGSDAEGKAVPDATCADWTSSANTELGQVGHSNRTGGGRPPSWNSTHTVGCAPSATNRQMGTVTQGGGRGSIYCFALP